MEFLRSKKFWLIIGTIVVVAVLAGGGYYYWTTTQKQETSSNDQPDLSQATDGTATDGTAFDWRTGEVLYNYQAQSDMPEGWTLYTFSQTDADGNQAEIPVWMPTTNPGPGSRTLQKGVSGDDVKVLQSILNSIKPANKTDQYYFNDLAMNGQFDDATEAAVKKMQNYFSLDANGQADSMLFTQMLDQVVTKEDTNATSN